MVMDECFQNLVSQFASDIKETIISIDSHEKLRKKFLQFGYISSLNKFFMILMEIHF